MPYWIARGSGSGFSLTISLPSVCAREILHGNGVVAAHVDEVVDADDVLVRDLARVAQLVHEALHHLLVLRHVRVQELQDQPLVDDRVLDQHHRAERALADLLDELVASFDDVAVLERGDVHLDGARRGFLGLLEDLVDVAFFDQQRARRLRHLGRLDLRRRCCGYCRARVAVVDLLQRADRGLLDRLVGGIGAGRLDVTAHAIGALVVGQPRERVDGLDLDLLLRALQQAHHRLDHARVAELAERARHGRQRARIFGVQQLHQRRHCLLAADFRERVHGPLAHPPVLVLGRLDQEVDRALVLGLVQDLDRRAAHFFVFVADQLDDGVHDARPADLAERVRGARAHPPIVVLDDLQQLLDVARRAQMVQHFDRGAPCVLVLVFQHLDEVLHRVRVLGAHHHVDRAVGNLEVRVAQQLGDRADGDRAVHLRQCVERGLADQLARILELRLDRGRNVRAVEARQDVDDVNARQRVLALDAADQLGDRRIIGELADDAEQRHLLVRLLAVGVLQQVANREALLLRRDDLQHRRLRHFIAPEQLDEHRGAVVVARRERPGHGRDRARAAVGQAGDQHREGLVVDQLRQDLDVRSRFLLVCDRERIENFRDRAGTDLRELLERLLRFGVQRIANSADLRDQPLSFQIRKETHPVISVPIAAGVGVRARPAARQPPAGGGPNSLVKRVPRKNGTDVRIACCKSLCHGCRATIRAPHARESRTIPQPVI